jgi:hypothetical protein
MDHIFLRLVMGALAVSLVAMGGCVNLGEGTKENTRFYMLNSLPSLEVNKGALDTRKCLAIGLGPVAFPEYLNRPQIVTRVSQNEIKPAEFHWWAESLKENFSRVVAQNLSSLLCTRSVAIFPWKGSTPIDYRVGVEVIRLDGSLGGNSELIAHWAISDGDGKTVLLSRESSYSEPVGPQNYEGLVSAQSRAVETLSRDIAQALKTLAKKKYPRS